MIWMLAGTAFAAEATGYVEARGAYLVDVDGVPWETVQRLRPTLRTQLHERVELSVTPQLSLVQGRYPYEEGLNLLEDQLGSVLEQSGCSLEAPDRVDEVGDVLTVERLFVDLYHPRVDLRVGRQALNWGSAMFLNPTDLFAQNLMASPWQERQGVNAVRATLPFGGRHQVVAVAALADDLETWRFGLRPTVNVLQTDLALVGGYASQPGDFLDGSPVIGLDLRGQLVLGWWAEGRLDLVDDPVPVVSAGLDYSFAVADQLVVAAQYSYDGTGVEDPALYSLEDRGLTVSVPPCLGELSLGEPTDAPRTTIGRHYALATTRLAFLDVWTVQGAALMNLQDRSTVLIPQVSWTPGQRVSWVLGGNVGLGEGEFVPTQQMATFKDGFIELDASGLVPRAQLFSYVRFAL